MKISSPLIWRYLPVALCVAVAGAALVALHHILDEVHLSDVLARFSDTPLSAVLLALVCTFASYLTLTGYDATALRQIDRPLPYRQVALASFISFAFSHNIGLAVITGGSIRYRIYSTVGISGSEIALLTAICGVTYALGLGLLLGLALLLEPQALAKADSLPVSINEAAGIVVLLVVVAYVLFAALRKQPFNVREWSVPAPGFGMTFSQLCIGAADVSFAAAALYFVLPSGLDVGFAGFVGIYVAAMTVGALSHLPGGIGVFEAVMLLAFPDADKAALLGALLVYRCIYYFLPFGLAASLLAGLEFRQRWGAITPAIQMARDIARAVLPQVLGATVFFGGVVLMISSATPADGARMTALSRILPLPFVEASHLTSSILGFLLLILAHGLFRRIDGAFYLTAVALGAGIVASLAKGFDYKEALILAVVLLLLIAARGAFYRKASLVSQSFSPAWLASIAAVIAATIWLGFIAHRGIEYSASSWWLFAFDADAPRFLRASLLVAVLGIAFLIFSLLRPSVPNEDTSEITTDELDALVKRAPRADAALALMGDKRFLLADDGEAFLMYQVQGRSWVALGDPIGPGAAWEPLMWRFRELCDRHGGWPVFYQVSTDGLPHYIDLGLSTLKLGEEARVDLEAFSLEGSARHRLRYTDRHVAKEGAVFEVVPAAEAPAILAELRSVSDEWLAAKATHEKGFSVGAFSEDYLRHFDCAVARREGQIFAFANLFQAPSGGEMAIDLMRHRHEAPAGIMDFLFVELMLWGKAQGYKWFNLGMAPLSGLENHPLAPAWPRIANLIYRHGEHFYNFEGLRAYKEKFDPTWEPKYLVAPGGLALPRILLDVASLISGGTKQILRK